MSKKANADGRHYVQNLSPFRSACLHALRQNGQLLPWRSTVRGNEEVVASGEKEDNHSKIKIPFNISF